MRTLIAGIVFSLIASSSGAQWLRLPTPGIPRTPDGKPNLTAPAPRTRDGKPDLSGMWEREGDHYYNNAAADLKPADVKPWAQALYQRRSADFQKDSMEAQCLPLGPAAVTTSDPVKFIQTPSLIVILFEDLTYRAVVSLSGDTLFLDLDHEGPLQLMPISDTSFSESGNVIRFLPDGHGTVSAFLYVTVEGEQRAVRVR